MVARIALFLILILLAALHAEAAGTGSGTWGLSLLEATQASRLVSAARPSDRVVVAIIDTGADVTHPDLQDHLWINTGETGRDSQGRDRSNNGIDDDGNGYIDDVNGWNFPGRTRNVADQHGHGTHIAGIIASVAPQAKLMILKYYDPLAVQDNAIPNTVRAIDYAVRNGARVINYSAGGPRPNAAERAAIERARAQGVLVVAAAGNESSNSDVRRYYPADYGLSNILSVTAVNPLRQILPSSNWGLQTVQLAAPGEAILSTLPGRKYGRMTGTSQATAFASGAAALILSRLSERRLTPEQLIEHLINSGTRVESLSGRTQAQTILNAYQALAIEGNGVSASGAWASNTAGMEPRLFTPEAAD